MVGRGGGLVTATPPPIPQRETERTCRQVRRDPHPAAGGADAAALDSAASAAVAFVVVVAAAASLCRVGADRPSSAGGRWILDRVLAHRGASLTTGHLTTGPLTTGHLTASHLTTGHLTTGQARGPTPRRLGGGGAGGGDLGAHREDWTSRAGWMWRW